MKKEDIRRNKLIKKQIQKNEKQEGKLLNKQEIKFVKDKIAPIQEKIENKIPKKLQQTLEGAFEAGFKLVFEKGVGIIEKSYSKEDKHVTFDINHYTVLKQTTNKNINKIDKSARNGVMFNQLLTTVEGSVLGALGIGLPDIPLFIGMLLKSIYEISLSYGFDYAEDKEKLYILYVICVGITKTDIQANYNERLDELARVGADRHEVSQNNIDEAIKETAHYLAEAMLVTKFIQGLPIVGVVGGLSNYAIMKDVSKMARVKYKKRYLERVLIEE